jgi:hypothetical protein
LIIERKFGAWNVNRIVEQELTLRILAAAELWTR